MPNSIVVSRGCPHVCDFCYKEAFFEGGRSFYTQTVDAALAEIERLPGRHLYFLDDHLFGDRRFASALFDGMRGMGRLWQAAGTVNAVLAPDLLEKAVECRTAKSVRRIRNAQPGESAEQRKYQNLRRDYAAAIRRLHDLGVMINGSFVFGMDGDDGSVFERTVEWAIEHGIETATFHILTPYPGTALYRRLAEQGRLTTQQLGSLRHAAHGVSSGAADGRAARARVSVGVPHFYTWRSIARGAAAHDDRHRRAAPFRLCGRMEEVRTDVGFRDSREARRDDAARARVDPQRVRPTIGALDQCRRDTHSRTGSEPAAAGWHFRRPAPADSAISGYQRDALLNVPRKVRVLPGTTIASITSGRYPDSTTTIW